nr:CHAT domain-containing tetratricopeptide repeat protein [Catenibacterium mitsuokai]
MNQFLVANLIKQAEEGHKAGNYRKENSAYKMIYNLYKSKLGRKNKYTIDVLELLADSYRYLGVYNKALELYKEICIIRKEISGKYSSAALRIYNKIAISYDKLGDYKKEFELENRVYNVAKDLFGENHTDTLKYLSNLAVSYYRLGDYKKSLTLLKTVNTKIKNKLEENHPDTFVALENVALSYRAIGDYNKACELENIVYNARKEILGEKHPDTFVALENVALSYRAIGDYNKACELENIVYNARKEILGEKHPDTLTALLNLAISYSCLGDYNKALELGKTVYSATKELLGENHPDTLSTLWNLASFYSYLGDYYKALELDKTVYNAKKEILGETHPDTLTALHNLASSYSDLGEYSKALELKNTAYNAFKEILGETHPDTLSALDNLAVTFSDLGDYSKACELQNVVYNARKEFLGETHPDTLPTLNNLASSYSKLGDYNKAFELQNIVYNARKEILGENHPNTLLALSNLLISQIFQNKADNKSIKKHMTAYFENINKIKRTAFGIKEVSSRRNFLKSYNNLYKLLKSCVFERDIHDLLGYLFTNKNLSFEIDVNRFHNETMGERLSLEEVTHLIKSQLIIDFYELDNSMYGLIFIKEGKYSQFVVDYDDIINGSFINDEDIQSFIGSLEDYDHIYICPDGELYNVSFERVLNCSNISYLSSVQTLFKKNTDDDSTDQLVSFVYPDFSGRLSDDNDRGDKKGVLYGSYLEGMFIQDIYGEQSTIYSSYQANHDNFLNTKSPRILHVSTHGDYLDNENMDPMDRGILCLSGYNVEDNNSGYISAREIQYMDLKGTELAVLSACNTGLGENISGEGIYGIRRAFELAGCQTLLLTVEEVDDFNSAIFMKSFYERYNETNNIYQSFKDTKEYLKEDGLKELRELKDVFEDVMKNKINSRIVYTRNLKELNRRIEESETREQIVRKKNGEYVVEDWNGFIIQGKIENS